MRTALRVAVVAIVAVLEIAGAIASIAAYDLPLGTYGFAAGKYALRITTVAPDSPATRAGLLPGDALVYSTLPLALKKFVLLSENVPAGATSSFQVRRDGKTLAVTLRAQPLAGAARAVRITYAVAGLALGIVGLALVLLRPSRMTWAFAFTAPPLVIPISLVFWSQASQTPLAGAWDAALALLYAAQVTGALIFAARFPDDAPRGVARVVDRIALPIGVALAALYLYVVMDVRYGAAPPTGWITLADYVLVIPGIAALAALLSTYATTAGDARSRILPVAGSFVVLIVTGVLRQIGTELTTDAGVLLGLSMAFAASPALVAAAVAYGVVRHRVMDVNFIVSRTLVYTAITVCAIAIFSIIEYIFGKLLDSRGVATLVEIAAAIGLGLSIDVFQRRLDGFVDRVLFRRRHLAERRLADAANALPHAAAATTVDAALVDEPAEALGLASAAVFRRNGDSYRRVSARGWDAANASTLEDDDRLVLRMRAGLAALDPADVQWERPDLPTGEAQVLYAVPVVVERRLEAVALYGGHTGGAALDPDERRNLLELARAGAAAYDHIETSELREMLASARAENAALRGVEQKLTELLGRRLPPE